MLLFFIYGMIAIREERDAYLDTAIPMSFGPFSLPIPSWWTKTSAEDDESVFVFERTDTRYEWYAEFLDMGVTDQSLIELTRIDMEKHDIILDQKEIRISEACHLFTNEKIIANVEGFIRLEGTGTKESKDRIYLDYVLFRLKDKTTIMARSQSSVLNGVLEGPYFEEVLKNAKFS
ncbi:MAG: hypothetical protein HOE90_20480 [Bacteriovoracaceae bacterium]|nr:hypothetical protein [Bacteriovoracaceae bacterium]